jgi:hypothetical protein
VLNLATSAAFFCAKIAVAKVKAIKENNNFFILRGVL